MIHHSDHPPIRDAALRTRIVSYMLHCERYTTKGLKRLAEDAGVDATAIGKLIRGDRNPSYLLVLRVVEALEYELGRTIDLRDVVAERPHPTEFACAVAGCPGCIPPWAYHRTGKLKAAFKGIKPGEWTIEGSVGDLYS